ncbi:MAG: hypothetical protein OJF49_000626 [Ktedonobacterales bacterium]|nr:MAG: hypothetical protein OJF49_000626 [Ktedonobacterales bacterium]
MSGKEKRRCGRCGKAFKPANAKQVLCADCEAKERQARAAAKVAVAKPTSAAAPAQQPKIVGPGAGILVPGMAPQPTELGSHAPASSHGATHPQSGHQREHDDHHASHHTNQPTGHTSHSGHAATAHEKPGAGAKPVHAVKTPTEPKAPRAPKPPPTPVIQLTDELRAKIEQRYLELAQPVEFDGIRTQIATELSIPKALVKKAVLELRQRMQMPSWWELQSYDGGESDLERIRAAYLPLLPVPDVGAHKQIAETLSLDPRVVYQGIRRLRAEMRLPQYNPPDAHTSADGSTTEAGAS